MYRENAPRPEPWAAPPPDPPPGGYPPPSYPAADQPPLDRPPLDQPPLASAPPLDQPPPASAPPPGPPQAYGPPDPTLPPGPPPFWAYTPPAVPIFTPARRRWGRARRACVVLAVLGIVAALGATAVAVQYFREARTPEAAVRAYFAALARGDAATALAAGSVPEGGRALVSADVLRASLARSPIDDVTTGRVTRTGDAATVNVRYRLGGVSPEEVDDTVDLRRVDGRWQLRRSAVPLTLAVDDAATWAAVPAATPFAVPADSQLVFPGAVPVFFQSPLLAVAASGRAVRFAGTADSVHVTAEPSADGRSTVTRTVVAALTACVAGGADVDPFCPQPPAGREKATILRAVPQSFVGELQRVDQVDLDLAVAPDGGGTFTVSGTVDASGKWQVLDYDNVARERSGDTSITFGGTVSVGAVDVVAWERS